MKKGKREKEMQSEIKGSKCWYIYIIMTLWRWSLIAGRVPGRTDNQVKNHWNTHLRKKLGIKKQNRKLLGASKEHSAQMEERNKLCSDHSQYSKLSHRTDSAKLMQGRTNESALSTGEASNGESQWMSSHFVESSPLISVDHPILDSPGFMELIDGYPFDLGWQSLWFFFFPLLLVNQ